MSFYRRVAAWLSDFGAVPAIVGHKLVAGGHFNFRKVLGIQNGLFFPQAIGMEQVGSEAVHFPVGK
ncbi:hypothetical protein D3C87_2007140 [compost metagenome]